MVALRFTAMAPLPLSAAGTAFDSRSHDGADHAQHVRQRVVLCLISSEDGQGSAQISNGAIALALLLIAMGMLALLARVYTRPLPPRRRRGGRGLGVCKTCVCLVCLGICSLLRLGRKPISDTSAYTCHMHMHMHML